MLPDRTRGVRIRITSSGMIVSAVRADPPEAAICSIIVPVYNERRTFGAMMDALLAKELPGLRKQIIVVESNSRDGTRELALEYGRHPDIEVVLQDRPRGKGHAVRAGFARARGQIVLIQDADLEYDLNDYDALLEPLVANRAAFVLGIRHGGSWKMRQFSDQQGLATALNLGHVFFTTLMNVLYGQRMSDPFTMFKVFRRDCLYGLAFEANRFDFDIELVIKLLRKGYRPLEIPVNYRSRSFKEGKKVGLIRDPLSWIWINLKLRFSPIVKQ
jgi:glycosyltransferase involved in cell wall biosynthesis